MRIVHLTASTFFGGPERQILGLARALVPFDDTVFLSFSEGNRCHPFLHECRSSGFRAMALKYDTPRFWSAINEVASLLSDLRADVLCCHGYKANLIGRAAARSVGKPVIAVSRGWTSENWKVRLYETLDRWHLRWMDRVVCVSAGQAAKVRAAGVPDERIHIIHNSARISDFRRPSPQYASLLRDYFAHLPEADRPERIVVSAGRLSPEKGFDDLVRAAIQVTERAKSVGFVLFGEGSQRAELEHMIAEAKLTDKFILAGFRKDLDSFLPWADLFVLPSHTEGMPNVILESFAAGVPVVATAVGGTPEIVGHGDNGWLVPEGQPGLLAGRILQMLGDGATRRAMGKAGRQLVQSRFTFAAQAEKYRELFEQLRKPRKFPGPKGLLTSMGRFLNVAR